MEHPVGHRLLASVSFTLVAAVLAAGIAGCAGAQPKQSGEGDDFAKPADSSSGDTSSSDTKDTTPSRPSSAPSKPSGPPSPMDELNDAQKEQLEIALRRGGDKSKNCDKVVPGTPYGEGEVTVTFDGKRGRAIDVAVPAPWAGTDAEACIKRAFVGEIVVPFDGKLEVPYAIKVGTKADPTPPTKGGKKK